MDRCIGLMLYLIIFCQACSAQSVEQKNTAILVVKVPETLAGDTMILNRYDKVLSIRTNHYLNYTTYHVMDSGTGSYYFKITNLKKVEYIVLGDHQSRPRGLVPILYYYPIYPGDSIVLKLESLADPSKRPDSRYGYYTQYKLSFSGRGSAKYQFRYQIERRRYMGIDRDSIDVLLKGFKAKLDDLSWGLLNADLTGQYENRIFGHHYEKIGSPLTRKTDAYFKEVVSNPEIMTRAKILSLSYPKALILRTTFRYPRHSFYKIINSIWENYSGLLRDKMLTVYSLENSLPDSALLLIMNKVETPFCIRILKDFVNSQKIGGKAFDFSLPDQSDRLVKLSDFKGKIVYLDFWFTGCHACSILYQKQLSRIEAHYRKDSGVVFISISVDREKNKWLESIQSGLYTSPSVINLYTGGKGGRGTPVVSNYSVHGYPTLFLIDKEGRIRARDQELVKKADAIREIDHLLK